MFVEVTTAARGNYSFHPKVNLFVQSEELKEVVNNKSNQEVATRVMLA